MASDSDDLDFRHALTADGQPLCARMISATLDLIANKWAVPIILTLARVRAASPDRTLRFSELSRAIPLITQKELTKQLRALETAGTGRPSRICRCAAQGGILADRSGAVAAPGAG